MERPLVTTTDESPPRDAREQKLEALTAKAANNQLTNPEKRALVYKVCLLDITSSRRRSCNQLQPSLSCSRALADGCV